MAKSCKNIYLLIKIKAIVILYTKNVYLLKVTLQHNAQNLFYRQKFINLISQISLHKNIKHL